MPMLLLLFAQEQSDVSYVSFAREENKHVTVVLLTLALMLVYFF